MAHETTHALLDGLRDRYPDPSGPDQAGFHEGYTEVISVRPSTRHGPDGFLLRETICEYVEIAEMFAAELQTVLGVERPEGMSSRQRVTAYGGAVLVFDQYGRIKYHIRRALSDGERQLKRLRYLWESGAIEQATDKRGRFAVAHLNRARVREDK